MLWRDRAELPALLPQRSCAAALTSRSSGSVPGAQPTRDAHPRLGAQGFCRGGHGAQLVAGVADLRLQPLQGQAGGPGPPSHCQQRLCGRAKVPR